MPKSNGLYCVAAWAAVLASAGCSPAPEATAGSPAVEPPSFVRIAPPSGPGAMAPRLTVGVNGTWLTWLEPEPGEGDTSSFRLQTARLRADGWEGTLEIAAGEGFFANWADLPAVAESDGELFGHWLEKLGDATYAYGVQLARAAGPSSEEREWSRLGLLHDDASPTEHGFVSYAVDERGVQAFWLDGRAMVDGEPMQLRTALLSGETVPASTLLDERVCECCSTDAAMTSGGPIVVFRDRDEDETRNIAIVRAVDGDWSEPRVLHDDGWRIHGCPVNGPAVDAEGDRVAVAWFTLIDEAPRVQVAFSDDAGATFGSPIVVDGERPLGRVDLALDGRGGAFVSWLGTVGEGAEIRVRRVAPDGSLEPVRVVAETTQKRSAGVPQMVRDGDHLLFAWVEDREPRSIAMASLPLAGAPDRSAGP